MSSGNLNTYGGKKNNFSFQQNLLLINSAISAAAAAGPTEATLQLVLTAIQNGQDYEAKLIRDSSVPPENFLEVRIYDPQTSSWLPPTYYAAGSTTPVTIGGPGGPVAPIVYIDPTTLLSTIASNTTGLATPTTGLATSMLRVTVAGAGSIAPGKRRASFFNAGNADAQVNGAVLKRGESVTFSADGLRDTLAAISYDCLTSELLITTVG